ncbi:hypothetical protein BX616_001383 [Lobosporangium transversale]|nr:hypothetical protein BX616_001383 [Lobosporangium transversale]
MANQLKQSMEMTQNMNNMMELFLVSSLTITSRIERSDDTDKPLLILTTANNSQIPIPAVTGVLTIGKDNYEENKFERSVGSHATLCSSVITSIKRGNKETRKMQSSIYKRIDDKEVAGVHELDVLLPGMKCIDTFELNLDAFEPWIIQVETGLKSPGTGRRLSKKHECCVYLIDQCTILWSPGDGTREQGTEYIINMMTTPLRQILKVPVTEGINVGMRVSLSSSRGEYRIEGTVGEISEDKQVVELWMWSEDNSAEMQYILERICRELSILGECSDQQQIK